MTRVYQRPSPLLDVLEEYIGEAAFLYRACRQCLSDPERSWEDLPSREKRLDANLHGLVPGSFWSAQLLKPKLALAEGGDPGEAFVAGAVYPSLGLVEPMQWLIEALAAEPPHYRALINGLLYNQDKRLDPWLDDFLGHEAPAVRAAGVEILGGRQSAGFAPKILRLMDDSDTRVVVAAAGVAGTKVPQQPLLPLVNHSDPNIADKSARLLLRLGNREVIRIIRQRIRDAGPSINQRLVLLLPVGGEIGDSRLILEIANKQPEILDKCLLALGVLGSVPHAEHLSVHLADPSKPGPFLAAVQALHTISGKVNLPDFDLEEAKPADLAKYQSVWQEWQRDAGSRLASGTRYRLGAAITPTILLADLRRRGNPHRDLTFLELKYRHGCPVDFQPDGRYAVQAMQLTRIDEWVRSGASPVNNPG